MKNGSNIEFPRSFLAGRSMGDAVMAEREETISELVGHGFRYAPIAARASSWNDFYNAREALSRKDINGRGHGIAVHVKRQILRGLADDVS